MSLSPGTRLGHYDVTAKIGEGGMGEVWQARDTKLDRDVALKVLPEAFTSDPDRLARFEREAKVLASLNHPNIGSIYGLEEAEGVKALVLELVEGPTLADRIKQGAIPIDEALPIAKQIAEALEAAHERGIIHRDLKPANIKVKGDGMVKVLDFGLAKALEPEAGGDPSQSPTMTAAATQMGMLMGTAAYMSPEQAKGKTADRRADVWAFGVVLYEMLTGKRLFEGATASDTLAAVLRAEPDWDVLPRDTPTAVRRLLRRCVERDPKRRLQHVGDVRMEVEEALTTPASEQVTPVPVAPQRVGWRRPLPWVVGALVGSLVTGVAVWSATRPAPPRVQRFTLLAEQTTEPLSISAASGTVAISPDGQRIAYITAGAGVSQLHVRSVDQLTPATLVSGGVSFDPFFSPDGEWVAFFDLSSRALKRVSVNGGPVLTIAILPGNLRGASWGSDDTIIFGTLSSDNGLWRVPAGGGDPEPLTTPDPAQGEQNHLWPEILPGGRAVLFTIIASPIENSLIAVRLLETGEQKVVVRGGSQPRYVPTGHLVYGVAGTLWAVGFDLEHLETIGDPVPVLDGVLTGGFGTIFFRVSENGSLVYVPAGATPRPTLGWVNREGQMTPLIEGEAIYGTPRLSPDGTRVAFGMLRESGEPDIWIRELERGSDTRLTVEGVNLYPAWTPDGATVTFGSDRAGDFDLYSKRADLSGEAERLATTASDSIPGSWSPDGQTLVYYEVNLSGTARDIWTLLLGGDPAPFLVTAFNERAPRLSPNGHWLAYVSDQAGEDRVYVRPFPEGGRVIPISTGGGTEPVWSRDGRELFYRDGNQLLVVDVDVETEFTVGTSQVLF